MKVFLLKNVEKLGMAGEIVTVKDGFAKNFLFPGNLAREITDANARSFDRRARVIENRESVIESKTSMLAERIRTTPLTLKRKVHNGEKLYGAVTPVDIVELLAAEGIAIKKNQVILDKAIKKAGQHTIVIKLSSRLQPTLTLKIVGEAE